MINDLLQKLGFSSKEIDVYMAIQKHGKITPTDISGYTGIKRTTVYSIVGNLLKNGIISEDLTSAKKYINALAPDELINLARKEELLLERKKGLIAEAVTELKEAVSHVTYSVPRVQFIGEDKLEQFLYKQAPLWFGSAVKLKSMWLGFQDHSFAENFDKWIDWSWTIAPAEVVAQMLTNKSDAEKVLAKKKYPNRLIKYFKEKYKFEATTWAVGEYIVHINTRQRPFYAIEIRNTALAESQAEIFRTLWEKI